MKKEKENNQIKPEKGDLEYLNCPNLTKEQRQQLSHASYPEQTPEFVRSSYIIKELKTKCKKR